MGNIVSWTKLIQPVAGRVRSEQTYLAHNLASADIFWLNQYCRDYRNPQILLDFLITNLAWLNHGILQGSAYAKTYPQAKVLTEQSRASLKAYFKATDWPLQRILGLTGLFNCNWCHLNQLVAFLDFIDCRNPATDKAYSKANLIELILQAKLDRRRSLKSTMGILPADAPTLELFLNLSRAFLKQHYPEGISSTLRHLLQVAFHILLSDIPTRQAAVRYQVEDPNEFFQIIKHYHITIDTVVLHIILQTPQLTGDGGMFRHPSDNCVTILINQGYLTAEQIKVVEDWLKTTSGGKLIAKALVKYHNRRSERSQLLANS